MHDMKDPIQGTLDAVREVEIRVGQIRLLWAEAERASAAEVETPRAELARKDEDVERFRARAKQDRRDRFECEESLESARATIWGFVCVATNMLHSAESAARELKRLRRSNEQVREVLGANHDESPVEAAERLRAEKDNAKAIMGREIERLCNERDAALGRVVKLEKACREGEQEVQALRESIAAVRFQRDKALARVEELEREVASLRSPRQSVEGEVSIQFGPMNVCCCSARQMARNECASALFRVLHPNKEPPQQGTYVFNTALAEVIEEINALRKDRETLNWVRGVVEVKP